MDNLPLVSIIIPVYNGSNYMREAIDSALSQTYKNVEVIVINDGSTDNGETDRIALSYGDKIKYYKKENGGVASALNLGISKMSGEYFSWLSHDDKYSSEKIESQINMLSEIEDEKVIAYCDTKQIDKNSIDVPTINYKKKIAPGVVLDWDEALEDLIRKQCYSGCALLIPKKAFDEAGLFDETLRFAQDMLMWMRIFLCGYKLIKTPGIHVFSRIHNGQVTVRRKNIFIKDAEKIAEIITYDLAEKSTVKYNFIYEFARYNAIYHNKEAVGICLDCGLKENKLSVLQVLSIRFIYAYGVIRPFIKKLYYKIYKRV